MKKILLLNRKYTDNLGDIAIGDSLKKMLELRGHKVYHLEYSTFVKKNINEFNYDDGKMSSKSNKNLLKQLYLKLPNIIRWNIESGLKLFKSLFSIPYKDIDLIIIGGGQLILSYPFSEQFTYSFNLWYLLNKYFIKSKLIFFGVGAGSYYSNTARRLYGKGLSKADRIFVRDHNSKEILEKEFNVKSTIVPDVAFTYSNILPKDRTETNTAIVGIYEYDVYSQIKGNNLTYENYYEFWKNKIKKLEEEGYLVKLFYTTGQDRKETQKFAHFLENKYEVISTSNVEELVKLFNTSSLVYSARMHALILAKVYGCKTLTFPVNDKLKTFEEMYDSTEINIEEIKGKINNKLDEALSILD